MKKYYLHNTTEPLGPFSKAELKSHGITASTQIWYEGLEDWTSAGELPELQSVLAGPPPFSKKKTSPPPFAPERGSRSFWPYILLTGVVLVVACLIVGANSNNGGVEQAYPMEELDKSAEEAKAKEAALTAKNMNYRNNWEQYIKADPGTYYYNELLGGISNLKITVNNLTDYTLDQVTVNVDYIKLSGGVYKTEAVTVYNIPANSQKTQAAPDSERGTSVQTSIAEIMCKKMHFCYPINNGNPEDPFYCRE